MTKGNPARQKLVETAMRLFRQRGYSSVGLNLIIKESGVPKGSLYYYFPDGKTALGTAAVKHAGELMYDMLSNLARKHRSSSGFIKGYCAQMATWMEESGFQDGSPIATTILETVPASRDIQQEAQRALASWIDVIAGVFMRGGLTPKAAQAKAEALVAAVEGSLILARVHESKKPILNVANQFI